MQLNSESDNETVTSAKIKIDNPDEQLTSDEKVPHVEPKPSLKRKLRKQHKKLGVMKKSNSQPT